MKPTIIFDIDGTLADITHRRVHVQGPTKDWKAFGQGIADDIPHHPVVAMYRAMVSSGEYDVILLSGREEEHRATTENWFKAHDLPLMELYLRPHGDFRPDDVVKEDVLKVLRAEGRQILFAVEDRQRVVDMWRRNGVVCLQCDVGDF